MKNDDISDHLKKTLENGLLGIKGYIQILELLSH
jgi:hypothetical protein